MISILIPSLASAAEVVLFVSPGVTAPEYNQLVSALNAGDEVVFSDGSRFVLTGVPRAGNTTLVLPIMHGRALRIPIRSGASVLHGNYGTFIEEFIRGEKALRHFGVNIVQLYPDQSLSREYVMVDWLESRFSYGEFLAKSGELGLSGPEYQQVLDDLVEFARSTWRFRNIGDIRPDQIAYVTGRGWVLFDWLGEHGYVDKIQHGTVFTQDYADVMRNQHAIRDGNLATVFEKLPAPPVTGLLSRIIRAIEDERRAHGMEPTLCNLLLQRLSRVFRR